MVEPWKHTQLLDGTLQNLFYPPEKYDYFARAGEMRFHQAGSLRKAAWAMDAAMLAYARYGVQRMTSNELKAHFRTAGLTCVKIGGTEEDWNAHGTQAVFAHCDDFAIFAFRGTEADDPDDLLSDLNAVPSPEPEPLPPITNDGAVLRHLRMVAHFFEEPCKVHRGFQRALDQVWGRVSTLFKDYRKDHPHAEICFTGHSLGGALAVLAFDRLADEDSSLYTFGCPRVGNAAFGDRLLSKHGRGIFRFVNYNDAVTHVPTESSIYRQAPEACQRFDGNGTLNADDGSFKGDVRSLKAAIVGLPPTLVGLTVHVDQMDLNKICAPPSLVDHSPARYCFRLWDCVRQGE